MAEDIGQRITDLLYSMDEGDLRNVIRGLQKIVGDTELLRVLTYKAEFKAGFDVEGVEARAAECADMDERKWYSMACTDDNGYYIDSGEHACDVIIKNLKESFENDLNQMVIAGMESGASEFLCAISRGLKDSKGILAEEACDFIEDFSEHL